MRGLLGCAVAGALALGCCPPRKLQVPVEAEAKKPEPPPPPPKPVEEPKLGAARDLRFLLDRVPAQAAGVALLDLASIRADIAVARAEGPMPELSYDEVVRYLRTRTGLDLDRLDAVVVFMIERPAKAPAGMGAQTDPDGAIVVTTPGDTTALSAPPTGHHGGVAFHDAGSGNVYARVGENLVLGTPTAVHAFIDVQQGKAESAAKRQPPYLEALAKVPAGVFVGAIAEVPAPQAKAISSAMGLRAAALGATADHRIVVRLVGRPDGLAQIVQGLEMGVAEARNEAKKMRDQADQEKDPWSGAAKLAAAITLEHAAGRRYHSLAGDTLSIDLPLGKSAHGGTALLVAGIGAAVAIPAFTKYIARSKTSEATTNVNAIARGVQAYWIEHRALPAAAGPTPRRKPGAEKTVPSKAEWDQPGWKAVAFAMADPHYYQYELRTGGDAGKKKGKKKGCGGQWFEAIAVGDLDGDGTVSRFVKRGRVNDQCELELEPSVAITDETE